MYGKSLSIPDHLIYDYFELVTGRTSLDTLPAVKQKAETDPRNAKHDLALAITALILRSRSRPESTRSLRTKRHQEGNPDDIPEVHLFYR